MWIVFEGRFVESEFSIVAPYVFILQRENTVGNLKGSRRDVRVDINEDAVFGNGDSDDGGRRRIADVGADDDDDLERELRAQQARLTVSVNSAAQPDDGDESHPYHLSKHKSNNE